MENSLKIFEYGTQQVRTVEKDGEVWFVAKDVCDILGLGNITNALKSLDQDELTLTILKSGGQNREMKLVSESGLYLLTFRSYKPEAKQFRRWVTHEVLPDIRKHGMYMSDKLRNAAQVDPEMFEAVVNKYLAEKEKARALEAKIEEDRPYTNIGHVVLALKGSITVTDMAQLCAQHGFDIGRNRLYKIYRDLGLTSKQKNHKNKPTQKGIEKGLVNLQVGADGNLTLTTQTMVTPEGIDQTLKIIQAIQRPLEALWEAEEKDEEAV